MRSGGSGQSVAGLGDASCVEMTGPVQTPVSASTQVMPLRRRRPDAVALGVGIAVTLALALLVSDPPADWEVEIFRALNGLPHDYERALWGIQQLGMALTVPIGAIVLWRLAHSWRPSLTLLGLAGALGWGAANIVREVVGRARPGSLLADVQLGYDVPAVGPSFPSGHAIVVTMLATVLMPYVSNRIRVAMVLLAITVAVARLYVGAHMPLDVAAGAAYGVGVGAMVNLAAGVRPAPWNAGGST